MPQTYNIIADTNYDTLVGQTLLGTDVFNILGSILTIDTDTRYCSNHRNTTGNLGSTATGVVISGAKGGQLVIDGTKSKLLRYSAGTGVVQSITSDVGLFANVMTWSSNVATIRTPSIVITVTTVNNQTTCTGTGFLAAGLQIGMLFSSQVSVTVSANTYITALSDTSATLSQTVALGTTSAGTFNAANTPTYSTGNTITIANAFPAEWNGTYLATNVASGIITVPITSDPGTIIQYATVTRRYMITQALTKTPASAGSYTISGAGPYLVTVALPNHNFASNNTVVVAGTTSSGTTMNGSWTATKVDNDIFTFSMPTSPTSVSVAGTITKTVTAEQLSLWNANTVVSTAYTTTTAATPGFRAVVTVTHAFQAGDSVTFFGYTPAELNGTYKVETITGTTSFTYFRSDNPSAVSVHGSVSCAARQLNMATVSTTMPGSNNGWLKVKNISNGPFEGGAVTVEGGTTPAMTLVGTEQVASIEIVGADGGVVTVPRQGKFRSTGEWMYPSLAPLYTQAVTVSGSAGAWTVTVTTAAYSGGAAQYHRLYVGQEVVITGVTQGLYNGTWRVLTIPTPTTFTYTNTTATTLNTATVQGTIMPRLCTTGIATRITPLPYLGNSQMGGVWVEKYPFADTGNGDNSAYDFYENQGTSKVAATFGTDYARGRVCWITASTGLLYIGLDATTASTQVQGYIPDPGCKIRFANIITAGIAAGTPQTNTTQTTVASRFKFDTTTAGYISIDKTNMYWQPTFAQPFYVGFTDSTIVDTFITSEIASPIAWDNIHVGQSAALATNVGLNMATCFAGGTVANCSFNTSATIATSASTGATSLALQNVDSFTFTDCSFKSSLMGAFAPSLAQSAALAFPGCAIYVLNGTNIVITRPVIINAGKIRFDGGSNNTTTDVKFAFNSASTYNNTNSTSHVWEISAKAKDITLNGLDWVTMNITSIVCTSNVVTVTTALSHKLATSAVVDVRGCTLPLYNAHGVTTTPVTVVTSANSTTVLGSTVITSSSLFVGVTVGMLVTGTGIPTHTYVELVTSTSSVQLTNACTAASSTIAVTFTSLNKFTYPKTAADVAATTETTMSVCLANFNSPMAGLLNNVNSDNIKLRNIGSYYDKLSLGTASASNYPAYIYVGSGGTAAINVQLKRIYTSSPRTGVINSLNSLSKLSLENIHTMIPFEAPTAPTGYRGTTSTLTNLTGSFKGLNNWHTIPVGGSQLSVYGTHFTDNHISTTESQINILGNEASAFSTADAVENVLNSTSSGFNSAGAIILPGVADSIIWMVPYKTIGHTGTQVNLPAVMAQTTVGTATVPGVVAALTVSSSSWAASTTTVNTHSNTTVDNITNTDILWVGCPISASGIPADAYIVSIDSTTSITISAAATTTLTGTAMTYSGEISWTTGTHKLAVGDAVNFIPTAATATHSSWGGSYVVSAITSATVFKTKRAADPGGTAPTTGSMRVGYIAISGWTLVSTTLTITTTFSHGFAPLDVIMIIDHIPGGTVVLDNINGKWTVQAVPSTVTFTITVPGSPGTTTATGTIRTVSNIKLEYDVENTGTWKPLYTPLVACSTASTGNGNVACADTSLLAVNDWVFGNNIAANGAKVTAISANVSFTLGRNNATIAGGASTTVSSFTCYATRFPSQVLPVASTGFNLKVRATNIYRNAAAMITNITLFTSSSRVSQAYQYALDTNTLTLTGLVSGTDVVINTSGTNTTIGEVDAGSTTFVWTFSGAQTVDIKLIKAGYVPYQVYSYALAATDTSLPIAQVFDRNYV